MLRVENNQDDVYIFGTHYKRLHSMILPMIRKSNPNLSCAQESAACIKICLSKQDELEVRKICCGCDERFGSEDMTQNIETVARARITKALQEIRRNNDTTPTIFLVIHGDRMSKMRDAPLEVSGTKQAQAIGTHLLKKENDNERANVYAMASYLNCSQHTVLLILKEFRPEQMKASSKLGHLLNKFNLQRKKFKQ